MAQGNAFVTMEENTQQEFDHFSNEGIHVYIYFLIMAVVYNSLFLSYFDRVTRVFLSPLRSKILKHFFIWFARQGLAQIAMQSKVSSILTFVFGYIY
ncbi:hypothetical protein ACJX0J_010859, partial [Zea mays]